MEEVLRVKKLKKTYLAGEAETYALKEVSYTFHANTFYAVIGKSGSGKSTLLHLLGGLDNPTDGEIIFQNQDISKLRDVELSQIKRKKFGFIFQAYNLLPELCVLENVLLPLHLDDAKVDRKYVEYILQKIGLRDKKKKYPSQLSGGEQQRVAIARALANKPQIIFADEPTGNLDQKTGDDVFSLLLKMKEELHQTVILVTHDMDIAKRADKIIHLQDGEIISQKML